jgi:hypothetical protein
VSRENLETVQKLFPPSDTDWVRLVHDDAAWIAFAGRCTPVVDPEATIRVEPGMGEATRTYSASPACAKA